MKNILKILCIPVIFVVIIAVCAVLHNKSLEKTINELTVKRDELQIIADEMIADSHRIDAQSIEDIQLLDGVFSKMFTFYNMEEFDAARDFAVEYNIPEVFVDAFYNKKELANMYTDSMLEILCRYDSSDIYLLKREDDTAYYYATVTLNTVKYSGSFDLAIFVSVKSYGDERERITSMLYYYIT